MMGGKKKKKRKNKLSQKRFPEKSTLHKHISR